MIRIRRGVDIPLAGEPVQAISSAPAVRTVGLVGDDYVGVKPALAVREGEDVALGQVLFTDRRNPGVQFTSPGCGTVAAINRGAKRAFQSIVIALDGDEEQTFQSYFDADLTTLTREQVRRSLLESGLWTALRTRPYSRIPSPETAPHSIFVTAIDTNPHAARPEVAIAEHELPFIYGLNVLRHLSDGKLYVCKRPGAPVPGRELKFTTFVEFAGPHPAGLPGTHIHVLDPVGPHKTVWHISWADVIAIGRLFTSGRLPVERVVSLAGPAVRNPRLVRTRLGVNVIELMAGETAPGDHRLISGSVLSGRAAVEPFQFLGRYHAQVSALREGRERVFLGWQTLGFRKFSVKKVYASAFFGAGHPLEFTTSLEGSKRPMVPVGTYETVMPLDIQPTYLLRSLIVGDTEQAQALGCLELDEDDLALCTFVCPGKYEYGPLLRQTLNRIEREG
ncbi:MAG TPA: Na(+)-translocating NADH-quinone reductase subunit A [Planctomycetaceae bacterium]|nr:Na(+)-translocating NADH-quinone reductase subunit A [Planctomycetaceae bacterium]